MRSFTDEEANGLSHKQVSHNSQWAFSHLGPAEPWDSLESPCKRSLIEAHQPWTARLQNSKKYISYL